MQLSKHFKLIEFTKSMTATRKGIDNSPGAGDIKNLGDVCYEILEPVRAHFDRPIRECLYAYDIVIVLTL